MSHEFSEIHQRERPFLSASQAVILSVLATLVSISALRRLVPLGALGRWHFSFVAILILGVVTRLSRGQRTTLDRESLVFGVCVAVGLAVYELIRLSSESNSGGFAVQMRSLGAEDASAWTRIAGSLAWQDSFLGWQGYGVVILLALVSGVLRPLQFVHGQEFGTIGFSTLVVSGAFSVLVMWIALVCTMALRRLADARLRVRIVIPVVIGVTLLRFINEAREMGHLTAALAAMTLLTVLLAFSTESARSLSASLPLVVALLGASLVWLPMAVVGGYAVLLVAWLTLGNRSRRLRPLLILGTGFLGWVLFRSMPSRAEELFTEGGGTKTVSSVVLVATILILVLLTAAGASSGRFVGPLVVVVAVLTIIVGDSYYNTSPGYGALKTLWVVTPVIFTVALIELARSHVVSKHQRFQDALAIGILLTVFAADAPQSVTRSWFSEPASDASATAADVEGAHWDTGYLGATRALEELPVACVIWNEARESFSPGWQGYLCSRYLGSSAAPTGCGGSNFCQQAPDPESYSTDLRLYGISRRSFVQVIVNFGQAEFDPRRTILIIDDDGAVLDEISLRTFVDQVVNP